MQKYQQIIDWVLGQIQEGTYVYGEKLPTESKLCKQFELSRQTVRRAIGELVNMQVVSRVQGSGTFVAVGAAEEASETYPVLYHRIAVISTYVDDYIFPSILKGIEEKMTDCGYAVQILFTNNQIHREKQILERLLEEGDIDGLIVEPAKSALPNPNLYLYQELKKKNVAVLFFNAQYFHEDFPCVRIDDVATARKAVEYLVQHGHRQIGAVLNSVDGQGKYRYQGFLEGLINARIAIQEERIVWIDTVCSRNLEEVKAYLQERLHGCTAVFCYNDKIAYQLIEMGLQEEMRIPGELSVISIDNSNLAELSPVAITTFDHPKEKLGEQVALQMLNMVEHRTYVKEYLLPTTLVERDSVADITGGRDVENEKL